jgi:oxygen-independent coproporphyrinogen-3 oxidase
MELCWSSLARCREIAKIFSSDAQPHPGVTAKWDNRSMPLGLYLSVPFCRTKCSYCNFASDVFSRAIFDRYVERVCADLKDAAETAAAQRAAFERTVDSIYLGGGTPTVLDIGQLQRLFVTISQNFEVLPGAEITVECAPGTLNSALLEAFQRFGVNRVSLGVQSFVDAEAASVGRLHKRQTVFEELRQLRAAGIANINVDLIAGLPHQARASWHVSLSEAIGSGVPHVSVYMLEVDEDSRLGRELIAGGTRYHAHFVPDEDLTADLYLEACERLDAAGIRQYEISNFGREGAESRHNLKYWTRQPYLGFGVDAHSMLWPARPEVSADVVAIRFAAPDSLESYLAAQPFTRTLVTRQAALEEAFFLGLRLTKGVDLKEAARQFGKEAIAGYTEAISEFVASGLLERRDSVIHLTPRGRLLSNEVFERFVATPQNVR